MCTFFVGDIVLEKIYELLVLESEKASIEGEVPISAIIVKGQQILSVTHNLKEKLNDVTAHAEILAIQEASRKLKNWRLDGCDIYVSLEPCSMCASAIHQSRIDHIYYFVERNCESFDNQLLKDIVVEKNSNKKTEIIYIDCGNELKKILQDFFKNRR